MIERKFFRRYLRWSLYSALCGVLAGLAAAAFLFLLDLVTQYRLEHAILIAALPLGGFAVGWLYHHFGKDVAGGNNLILEEIHDPKKTVPLRMAPLILFGTLVTHLLGGSAGREGTAVQMGASLADQLSRWFRIEADERKILLVAGAGAGFGAAIGTPLAGVIFGMEVIHIGRLRLFAWFECLIASFVAYGTVLVLGVPHSQFPHFAIPTLSLQVLCWVAIAGVIFGWAARLFALMTHGIESLQRRWIAYPPLKPAVAGLLLILLYNSLGSLRYAGLGISVIQEALQSPVSFLDPVLKMLFSALTVGSGFKGGEFIPLVFIGSTLGNALAMILPLSCSFLAGLGFAAVFAGASNTPLACSLMAMELFGFEFAPYALLACYMSYYSSGHSGIYRSQKILMKKHQKLLFYLVFLGELPKRFLQAKK